MNIIGQIVVQKKHLPSGTTYRKGVITQYDGQSGSITVRFNEGGEAYFHYPDAFTNKNLKADSDEFVLQIQQSVKEIAEKKQAAAELAERQRIEREEQAKREQQERAKKQAVKVPEKKKKESDGNTPTRDLDEVLSETDKLSGQEIEGLYKEADISEELTLRG